MDMVTDLRSISERIFESLLRVITGLGRPLPAASAVRGEADLIRRKADIAAGNPASAGLSFCPSCGTMCRCAALGSPVAPLTSTRHDKKRLKSGRFSTLDTPHVRPWPAAGWRPARPGPRYRGRPTAPGRPGDHHTGRHGAPARPHTALCRAALIGRGPTHGPRPHGPRVRYSVAGPSWTLRARAREGRITSIIGPPPMDYRDNPQHLIRHHIKWTNFTPPFGPILLRR